MTLPSPAEAAAELHREQHPPAPTDPYACSTCTGPYGPYEYEVREDEPDKSCPICGGPGAAL